MPGGRGSSGFHPVARAQVVAWALLRLHVGQAAAASAGRPAFRGFVAGPRRVEAANLRVAHATRCCAAARLTATRAGRGPWRRGRERAGLQLEQAIPRCKHPDWGQRVPRGNCCWQHRCRRQPAPCGPEPRGAPPTGADGGAGDGGGLGGHARWRRSGGSRGAGSRGHRPPEVLPPGLAALSTAHPATGLCPPESAAVVAHASP
jgi:hypothetical protein